MGRGDCMRCNRIKIAFKITVWEKGFSYLVSDYRVLLKSRKVFVCVVVFSFFVSLLFFRGICVEGCFFDLLLFIFFLFIV